MIETTHRRDAFVNFGALTIGVWPRGIVAACTRIARGSRFCEHPCFCELDRWPPLRQRTTWRLNSVFAPLEEQRTKFSVPKWRLIVVGTTVATCVWFYLPASSFCCLCVLASQGFSWPEWSQYCLSESYRFRHGCSRNIPSARGGDTKDDRFLPCVYWGTPQSPGVHKSSAEAWALRM